MKNSFELERHVFVGGLHWQALSGNPSEHRNEAQRLAKELRYDLAVWRTSGTHQIGFASMAEGFKDGMMSAAAVISKTLEVEGGQRDFLCATELPDGRFLYVSQADGVIVAEGDLIDSAERIRSRLLEDLSLEKTWGMVIAPMLWGIEKSTERPFEDFLPKKGGKIDFKHAWWCLRPLKPSLGGVLKTVLPFAGIGVVMAIGLLGYQEWRKFEAEEAAARMAAAQQADAPKAIPRPWKDQPRAAESLAACMTSFESLSSLWPGNWMPTTAVCSLSAKTMTVTWKRGDYGWIHHLLAIEPRATISPDGKTAALVVPLPSIPAGEEEALMDERVRTLAMHGMAQELAADLQVAMPQAAPSMPGAQAGAPVTPWKELAWTVKSSLLPPTAVAIGLDGPGFRVESIVASFTGGVIKWDMEGKQYVRP